MSSGPRRADLRTGPAGLVREGVAPHEHHQRCSDSGQRPKDKEWQPVATAPLESPADGKRPQSTTQVSEDRQGGEDLAVGPEPEVPGCDVTQGAHLRAKRQPP